MNTEYLSTLNVAIKLSDKLWNPHTPHLLKTTALDLPVNLMHYTIQCPKTDKNILPWIRLIKKLTFKTTHRSLIGENTGKYSINHESILG
jgi:hypothetical protein